MTNREKMRQMNNEELTEFIITKANNPCKMCIDRIIPTIYCTKNGNCAGGMIAWFNSEAEE